MLPIVAKKPGATLGGGGLTSDALVRPAIATFGAIAFLLLLSNWAPRFAALLAVVLLASSFAVNGAALGKLIQNIM